MAEVRVGDMAPDVLLVGGDRQPVRVADLFGQPVVLAFFPGAFTGVCTREMCTFRDSLNAFTDVRVLDKDGKVTYRWVSDDPTIDPNYAAVQEAVRKLQAGARA